MTLGVDGEEKKMYNQQPLPFEEKDPYAPTLNEQVITASPVSMQEPVIFKEIKEERAVSFELYIPQMNPEGKKEEEKAAEIPEILDIRYEEKMPEQKNISSSGYLNKPENVYVQTPLQPEAPEQKDMPVEIKPEEIVKKEEPRPLFEEETVEMELVIKEDVKEKQFSAPAVLNIPMNDEEEEQKRRAEERIHKLRNLSYNMNSMDNNTEYENVPAYVRRNLELFGNNKLTSVEDFYSKVAVKKDENNQTQISTINTFLDGKKPD